MLEQNVKEIEPNTFTWEYTVYYTDNPNDHLQLIHDSIILRLHKGRQLHTIHYKSTVYCIGNPTQRY